MTRADIEHDVPGHVEDLYRQVEVLAERQIDHGHKLDALKATQDAMRDTQIEHGSRLGRIERDLAEVKGDLAEVKGLVAEVLNRLPAAGN